MDRRGRRSLQNTRSIVRSNIILHNLFVLGSSRAPTPTIFCALEFYFAKFHSFRREQAPALQRKLLFSSLKYRFVKALINFPFSIFNFPFNRRRPLQYKLLFCALKYHFAKFVSFREDNIFPYIKGTFSIVGEDIILPF